MEKAILDLAGLVAKSENPLAALLWMVLVGAFVWLPSLLNLAPQHRSGQFITYFALTFGLLPIVTLTIAPFFRLILRDIGLCSYWGCSALLLHLVALCLLAIWIWLQGLQMSQKGAKENVSEAMRDLVRRDWIMAARLALWLTLSLMPTVKWS